MHLFLRCVACTGVWVNSGTCPLKCSESYVQVESVAFRSTSATKCPQSIWSFGIPLTWVLSTTWCSAQSLITHAAQNNSTLFWMWVILQTMLWSLSTLKYQDAHVHSNQQSMMCMHIHALMPCCLERVGASFMSSAYPFSIMTLTMLHQLQ